MACTNEQPCETNETSKIKEKGKGTEIAATYGTNKSHKVKISVPVLADVVGAVAASVAAPPSGSAEEAAHVQYIRPAVPVQAREAAYHCASGERTPVWNFVPSRFHWRNHPAH
jgi:hypothetical protein